MRTLYSLGWAWNTYKRLYDRYPRATDIALRILNLKPKNLVFSLARGETSWPAIRKIIHDIDHRLNMAEKYPTYYTDVGVVSEKYAAFLRNSPLNTIDAAEILNRIKEQGFLGVKGGAIQPPLPEIF